MEKNLKYEIAMSETLHYLKGIRKEDFEKIPNKLIKFLRDNCSKEYECNFDYNKPLKELKLQEETKGIIAMICLNYWCETEEQKNIFINKLNENEKKYQQELREKYNPDNIFKKENIIKEVSSTEIVEYKEKNYIKIILNKIMNLFKFKGY